MFFKIILAGLIFAGFTQYWINYRIGTYFGFPRFSRRKIHHLTKLPHSFLGLIKYSPTTAKEKLQKDFIEKAMPEGIALLKPGYSMQIKTHLIDEASLDELRHSTGFEIYEPGFVTVGYTQLIAWLAWLIRSIQSRNFSNKPPRIVGRNWYKITWKSHYNSCPS